MRIEKQHTPAKIYCDNGVLIRGIIHVAEGQRVLDFANDAKEAFIPVTKVELYFTKGADVIRAKSKLIAEKEVVILNKSMIRWIEEEKG